MRVQGWDPVLIICQIISLQATHYLSLSLILPPLLSTFTHAPALEYSGGAATVGHVLDWREMASRPTISSWAKKVGEASAVGASTGGKGAAFRGDELWDWGVDERRGWILGLAWVMACAVDVLPLYHLVRRPTHILDFSLTLLFLHVVFTTLHTGYLPSSIYFWVVCALGALLMITVAEQLCVKREMSTDITTTQFNEGYANEYGYEGVKDVHEMAERGAGSGREASGELRTETGPGTGTGSAGGHESGRSGGIQSKLDRLR